MARTYSTAAMPPEEAKGNKQHKPHGGPACRAAREVEGEQTKRTTFISSAFNLVVTGWACSVAHAHFACSIWYGHEPMAVQL